ncbi:hypothetical protein I6F26_14780 [Ensifer sp. IC3342]|nr:hypothetical protein [Ensifer sp. BRP08]MCA1447843.1 hypothetical protein [Ensifer sp. IC3342]
MAGNAENRGGQRGRRWRIAAWTIAALVLLLPLIAMQFTDEVNWTETDFAFAGALIVGTALAFDLAVRMANNDAYRAALGVALAAAFLLIWINAAVGIIGSEDNPANLTYGGVLAVGITGAVIARFEPNGMARTMFASALVQALVAMIAVIAGMGYPASPPLEIIGVNALFVAVWLTSAWLFRKAARAQILADAASWQNGL